jgi:GntR family transcriptional repressor for pyruvate dehydrogenase complex
MKEGIIFKAPDRIEKVSDNIINQIRGLVASGELKPADKIGSEKELLAQFGVSKASLREALRVLEVMGIIEIRKGLSGGVYVADVDMKTTLTGIMNFINFEAVSIKDITLMRYILEPMIVRVIAPLISEADIQHLEEMNRLESGSSLKEASATSIKSIGFHRCLARITHNPILILVSDFIDNLLTDLKVQVNLDDDFYRKVRSFHQQVLDALSNHDVAQAIQILITDILFVDEMIANSLKSERFDPACLPESIALVNGGQDRGALAEANSADKNRKRLAPDKGDDHPGDEAGKILLKEVGSGKLYLFVGGEPLEKRQPG